MDKMMGDLTRRGNGCARFFNYGAREGGEGGVGGVEEGGGDEKAVRVPKIVQVWGGGGVRRWWPYEGGGDALTEGNVRT
jgi:hypothetical protein